MDIAETSGTSRTMSRATAVKSGPSPSLARRMLAYIGYGSGPFGACAALFPTGSLILYFLTDTIGLSVALATLAIALPKLWDVVVDPAIGAMIDRHSRRKGNRFSAFAFAAFALPSACASTFLFSWSPTIVTAVCVTFLLICVSTTYTIYWVTHLAAANDIEEAGLAPRNELMVARMIGQSAGGMFAGAVAPFLLGAAVFSSKYAFMAMVLATVGIIAMSICAWMLRGIKTQQEEGKQEGRPHFFAAIQSAIARPRALGLILSNFTVMIACTYVGTMLPYVNKYVLHLDDTKLSILFTSLMGAQVAGAAGGAALANKIGLKTSFLVTSICLLIAGAFFYAFSTNLLLLVIALVGWGMATGAYTVTLHSSMLDAAKGNLAAKVGVVGLLLGLLFATGKIGDTLGSLTAAASLTGSGGIIALQKAGGAGELLRLWFGVIPALLILLGIALVLISDKFTEKRQLSNTEIDLRS